MITALKLLVGDKRNPSRTLNLNRTDGKVFLRLGSPGPKPGVKAIAWSGPVRGEGRRRTASMRENATFELVYHLHGSSLAELAQLQRDINRFANDVRRYHEEAQGERVWLMISWLPGDLGSLPAPAWGQLFGYVEVLDLEPSWPQDVHGGLLNTATSIDRVILRVTGKPYAEGAEQTAGKGVGQLEIDVKGLLIPGGLTNLVTNPSFGHGTWNTDWAVSNADLKATNETRRDFTRSLYSAARLVNHSTSAQQFRQTLTLTAVDYFVSCYARRADGEAVTSSDLVMWGQGAALSTSFVAIDGGPWYLCYASYTAAASASTHGVQVPAGREVVIDDVQVALASTYTVPRPFCGGWMATCAWAGTAHASSSARGAPNLLWTLADELAGEYAIGGWMTPFWSNAGPGLDLMVVQYYVDANNYVGVYYDYTADRFEVAGARDGTAFSGNGNAQSFSMFANLHVMLVQDVTTCKLYVNGAQDISINTAVGQPVGGTLYLGNSQAGGQVINSYLDGWRIWKQALSITQVAALYTAELPVRQAYSSVGLPPFVYTKDGDNVIDAVNDANRDNWCLVGGVGGDVPASVKWEIYPPTDSPSLVYWLGRKATREPFDPAVLYAEFSGSASASSSGGEHYEEAAGTSDVYLLYTPSVARVMHWMAGRYQYLGRIRANTENIVVKPVYDFGSGVATSRIIGDPVTIATNAAMLFYDFGDLVLRVPDDRVVSALNYRLFVDRTASTAVQLDFFMLMPHPMVRLACLGASLTISAGEYICLDGTRAYTVSAGQVHDFFEVRGEEVNLEPGQYNTVYLMQVADGGGALSLTLTATIAAKITPRFLLAGGMLA